MKALALLVSILCVVACGGSPATTTPAPAPPSRDVRSVLAPDLCTRAHVLVDLGPLRADPLVQSVVTGSAVRQSIDAFHRVEVCTRSAQAAFLATVREGTTPADVQRIVGAQPPTTDGAVVGGRTAHVLRDANLMFTELEPGVMFARMYDVESINEGIAAYETRATPVPALTLRATDIAVLDMFAADGGFSDAVDIERMLEQLPSLAPLAARVAALHDAAQTGHARIGLPNHEIDAELSVTFDTAVRATEALNFGRELVAAVRRDPQIAFVLSASGLGSLVDSISFSAADRVVTMAIHAPRGPTEQLIRLLIG